MKRYKYILLDWDGTIARTADLWPNIFDSVLRKRNIHLTRKQVVEACASLVDYLVNNTSLSVTDSKEVLEEGLAIASKKLHTIDLHLNALNVLKELREQGKYLALITSSRRNIAKPLFEKHSLKDLFHAKVCVEDTKRPKPHPDPLHKALEILGGNPDEAIMIGDTPQDIIAASKAGMHSALFYPEEHKDLHVLEDLLHHGPTYVIKELSEILRIIKDPDIN